MPTLQLGAAKTVWVDDKPFNIPSTDIYIWKVKLEINGERDTYNTMSKKLATEGFEGVVEIYTNANGKEYVRQSKAAENPSNEAQKTWVDNSDGQKQGMAIKCAWDAWLAGKIEKDQILTTAQWIYGLEISKSDQPQPDKPDKIVKVEDDVDINAIFGLTDEDEPTEDN